MIRFRFRKKSDGARSFAARANAIIVPGGSSTSLVGKSAAACRNGLTPPRSTMRRSARLRAGCAGAAQDAIRRSNGAWRGTAKAARPNDRTPLRIAAGRVGARLRRWHLRLCNSLAGFQRGKSLGQGWYAHVERVASEARAEGVVLTFGRLGLARSGWRPGVRQQLGTTTHRCSC